MRKIGNVEFFKINGQEHYLENTGPFGLKVYTFGKDEQAWMFQGYIQTETDIDREIALFELKCFLEPYNADAYRYQKDKNLAETHDMDEA